jgi:hypothetical protein
MIFVTVGTHEQPFNRLIQKIDELKKDGTIQDDVIIQTGFSTYEPKYCQWSKLIPYQQMVKNVADARIVITHGGARDIIRGCHNRDKGTAENERLHDPKFIFSYPKNERLIFLSDRNDAQKEISTIRVG